MAKKQIIAMASALLLAGVGTGYWIGSSHSGKPTDEAEAVASAQAAESASKEKSAVVMAAYQQDLGKRPVVTLKNNTDEEITQVSYSLVFKAADGKQLDVQTLTTLRNIKPGETLNDSFRLRLGKRKYCYKGSAEDKQDAEQYSVEFHLLSYKTK